MKKILFLQNCISVHGGVWAVINTLAENFLKSGYEVKILALRGEAVLTSYVETKYPGVKWEVPHMYEVKQELKKFKFINSLKMINENLKLKKDIKNLKEDIILYNPDYIICNHYELLDGIPKEFYSRTIHFHHASFAFAKENKANLETLLKYKDKIYFNWLSKETEKLAIEHGFQKNITIYNPLKYKSDKVSNVIKNRKLIYIGRIAEEKRIFLLVDIAKKVLENHKDWTLDIYGDGEDYSKLKKIKHQQINILGVTNNVKECYLKSSISLNTSRTEGFCLTIPEASECGVPTISFNFGEAVHERIINNETGIIIENDDKKAYIKKLDELMINSKLLKELSKNCKAYNKNLYIENIIKEWIKLFNKIDKER